MITTECVILAVLAAFAAAGLGWYLFFYRREKALLERLQKMVDEAAEENLVLQDISESCLSALENSLKQYLNDSLTAREHQQSQKEVIQGLISDISHQTLTPVSNLKIYGELLQEELGVQSEIAETIREQTEKLDFLIQSLVKLSRMESGILTLHAEHAKICRLLELIRQEYEGKAREKQISLSICQTELSAVFDLKWTVEAVGNIVDNAIKYTPAGGKVTITAKAYSFFVRIDIKDTGIGIEEEEIPLVFGRFYRSLEVSEQPGVGLGLYLSREIIRGQKGYVKVFSRRGEGSVFSVFLPSNV